MSQQNEKKAKKASKQDIAVYIFQLRKLLKKKPENTTILDSIVYWKKRFVTAPFSDAKQEAKLHKTQQHQRRLAANRIAALVEAENRSQAQTV